MNNVTINTYLSPGETVIWQSSPNFLAWSLSKVLMPSIFLIPISLLILIGLINKAFVLVVFIPFVFFLDLSLFWNYYLIITKKGYPIYYITSSKKVIILAPLGGFEFFLKPYIAVFNQKDIKDLVINQKLIERLVGSTIKSIQFHLGFTVNAKQVSNIDNISSNPSISVKLAGQGSEAGTIAYSQGVNGSVISFESIDKIETIQSILNS